MSRCDVLIVMTILAFVPDFLCAAQPQPAIKSYSSAEGKGLKIDTLPQSGGAKEAVEISASGKVTATGPLILNQTDIYLGYKQLQSQIQQLQTSLASLQDQHNALRADFTAQSLLLSNTSCYDANNPVCGWTLAWMANAEEIQTSGYVWSDPQAVQDAAEMMIGYRNAVNGVLTQMWRVNVPRPWRTTMPLNSDCGLDLVTAVRVADGLTVCRE
jgi:hypothetical protein